MLILSLYILQKQTNFLSQEVTVFANNVSVKEKTKPKILNHVKETI